MDSMPSDLEQEKADIEAYVDYVRRVFTDRVEDFRFQLPVPNPDLQASFTSRAACDEDTASSG